MNKSMDKKKSEELLGEIISSEGLAVICSNCAKIKDMDGRWFTVGKYLDNYPENKFSHGMCNECQEILYGETEWYKEMKKSGK